MKREEAIQVLQTALTAPFIYGEYAEAIDMAIEALRNCSEIPNGSLIRRQDIKYHTQLEAMGNGQYEEVEVAYKNDIKSLPSADRTEQGRWEIKQDTDEYGLKRPKLVCSKCEKEPAAWDLTELFEFCPQCGARMVKNGKG